MDLSSGSRPAPAPSRTCVLGDVVQQQRVLGDSLHLHRDDVFEPQPAAQPVALGLLRRKIQRIQQEKISEGLRLLAQGPPAKVAPHKSHVPEILKLCRSSGFSPTIPYWLNLKS